MSSKDMVEIDAEIERILAMDAEECRRIGIEEFGSEEAWIAAMNALRDRMLKAVDDHARRAALHPGDGEKGK